jgi:muramoyltetrapeptide carboxypeptidase
MRPTTRGGRRLVAPLKAPALKSGASIALFSPSDPSMSKFPDRAARAVRSLTALGYRVSVDPATSACEGYTSGSPQARADVFNRLVRDPGVDLILATIGGLNTNAILPFIDFGALKRTPKIVVGLSDVTALLVAIQAQTGLITFHGPAALPDFGEHPAPFSATVEAFQSLLSGADEVSLSLGNWTADRHEWNTPAELIPRRLAQPGGLKVISTGVGEGTLFGGNLETLNMLVGTRYWRPPTQPLLFFEATGSETYLPRLDRALTQLQQLGLFDRCTGLIFGRSPDAKPVDGVSLPQLVTRLFPKPTFPILLDADIGHTAPIASLPIGGRARLRAMSPEKVDLKLLEPVVS